MCIDRSALQYEWSIGQFSRIHISSYSRCQTKPTKIFSGSGNDRKSNHPRRNLIILLFLLKSRVYSSSSSSSLVSKWSACGRSFWNKRSWWWFHWFSFQAERKSTGDFNNLAVFYWNRELILISIKENLMMMRIPRFSYPGTLSSQFALFLSTFYDYITTPNDFLIILSSWGYEFSPWSSLFFFPAHIFSPFLDSWLIQISICKFSTLSTLYSPADRAAQLITFSENKKAHRACYVLFEIIKLYGSHLREGWKNVSCIGQERWPLDIGLFDCYEQGEFIRITCGFSWLSQIGYAR